MNGSANRLAKPMTLSLDAYRSDRANFAVSREDVETVLTDLREPMFKALGVHVDRHALWDGELPVYPVITQAHDNAHWGELMPHWFAPYERPIPLHCLDNWALFAGLFREAFNVGGSVDYLTASNLLKVIVASDLLIAFLPSAMGAGVFLRHGALTIYLGILWLEDEARDAWLGYCEQGALAARRQMPDLESEAELSQWLSQVEQDAFLAAAGSVVAGEEAVKRFLWDSKRYSDYSRLFQVLAMSVTALAQHYGTDWETWIFQAVNVHYRLHDFGLDAIARWLPEQTEHW